ncbi:MAG: hypothetical protein Q8S13_07930 [Dehalococcoidia bacterium]|nr:hypothetical protein [Dehalococcoidia bacterium]
MLSEYKGFHCQHRSDDFPTLAAIIAPHKPQIVVELGTDEGGFSAWLADLVAPWGGKVWTFDREVKFDPALLDGRFPNLAFKQGDVLDLRAGGHYVAGLISTPAPTLIYCDNGNKVREIELYAPLLRVGSLLATHDYTRAERGEVPAAWAEPFVAALGYAPEGHDRMEALANEWYPEPMTRFWTRLALASSASPTPPVLPPKTKGRAP